jgi:hypothetical protein
MRHEAAGVVEDVLFERLAQLLFVPGSEHVEEQLVLARDPIE